MAISFLRAGVECYDLRVIVMGPVYADNVTKTNRALRRNKNIHRASWMPSLREDRTDIPQISMDTKELNNTLNQSDLI